jgi:hypothetical protein
MALVRDEMRLEMRLVIAKMEEKEIEGIKLGKYEYHVCVRETFVPTPTRPSRDDETVLADHYTNQSIFRDVTFLTIICHCVAMTASQL